MKRFFDWFTRLLVLWVSIAVGLGYFYPGALVSFRRHTEWFFALTMFGIGAVLSFGEFRPIFRNPHIVLLGTAAQFGIMPALGFMAAKVLRLPPDLALGMIMVGAVPGAMASNVVSYLAKGDVAYSISLTTASTFLSPILTPTFVYLLGKTYIEIKFLPMFVSIVKMVIVPLILGMWVKNLLKERLDRFINAFPALSALFIALICGLVVALNRDYLASVTGIILVAVFMVNLWGLLLGYAAGKLYGFDRRRCRTLCIEVGMQNAGLGAVLALKHLSSQSAVPNAFYATWCIITASFLAEIWSRRANV